MRRSVSLRTMAVEESICRESMGGKGKEGPKA